MLVSWPSYAHAQRIPWIVLPLAASPIVAILLSIALGAVTKRWVVGVGNTLLVSFWVIWFWTASNYSTSDWLVWASILALVLHSTVIVCLVAIHAFRRARKRNEA
jgi:hypothetical protein